MLKRRTQLQSNLPVWRVAKGSYVTRDEGKNKCVTREKKLRERRDSSLYEKKKNIVKSS